MASTSVQAAWCGKLQVTESQNLNWQAQKGWANNYARTILYYFSDLILKCQGEPNGSPNYVTVELPRSIFSSQLGCPFL